jgi:hypothetical protein
MSTDNKKETTEETKFCTSCKKDISIFDMRVLIRNLHGIKRYYVSANCKECYKHKQRELYKKNRTSRLEYAKSKHKPTGNKKGKRMNPKFNTRPVRPE